MTASGFRTAGVPPLLGRPLLPGDERAGAPAVMVLSYQVWRERFDADPSVVGATVRLDPTTYTVVGVMPKGFTFPAFHKVWTPLRVDSLTADPDPGPDVSVFAHLAPGVTRRVAQALFAEALVLASLAAVAGLIIAQLALNQLWAALTCPLRRTAPLWPSS